MNISSLNTELSINTLINRLAILIDSSRYDEAAQIFAPEGSLQRPGEHIQTRDAILASFKGRSPARFTRHIISSCFVEPDNQNGAKSTTYVTVFRDHGQKDEKPALPLAYRNPETIAEYHDVWVCRDEQWFILERVVKPVFEIA